MEWQRRTNGKGLDVCVPTLHRGRRWKRKANTGAIGVFKKEVNEVGKVFL